jgi:putative chitinase
MGISRKQFAAALYEDTTDEDIDKVYPALAAAMEEFGIDTPQRIAMFLAQCAHESAYFSTTRENLNYSADGLKKIFPKYFRDRDAQDYHRQPEKIANVVYSGRMGNGDEDSGDGWSFCGRGFIQLTGRSNYTACGAAISVDLTENPTYLETPEGAARSAAWFWKKNGLNAICDKDDIVTMTKRINGGTIGLDDRKKHYEHAKELLA